MCFCVLKRWTTQWRQTPGEEEALEFVFRIVRTTSSPEPWVCPLPDLPATLWDWMWWYDFSCCVGLTCHNILVWRTRIIQVCWIISQSPVLDKLEPVDFTLSASLSEPKPKSRRSLQNLDSYPILSHDQKVSEKTEVPIAVKWYSLRRCDDDFIQTVFPIPADQLSERVWLRQQMQQ